MKNVLIKTVPKVREVSARSSHSRAPTHAHVTPLLYRSKTGSTHAESRTGHEGCGWRKWECGLAEFSMYRIVTGDDGDQPCTRHLQLTKTKVLGSDAYASWAAWATSTCAYQTFELLH